MKRIDLIAGLPGEALVREGLADYQAGRCTIAACLAAIARPRLSRAGLLPGEVPQPIDEPELQLYRLLRQQGGDAYSRYNSLVRELVSFEQALDFRQTRDAASRTGQAACEPKQVRVCRACKASVTDGGARLGEPQQVRAQEQHG